jgi:glycosyltransferase involved in cell wall biosynthesis
MRKLLVNALSVTNQSGLHVLLGHGHHLIQALEGKCRLVVLCRENMNALGTAWRDHVEWVYAPLTTQRWHARALWEHRHLARVIQRAGAHAYFTPSGMGAVALPVPQVVFCQNPWALVRPARRRRDAPKAWLQRSAYRRTVRRAEVLIFNSRFMQEAYRSNAGCRERAGHVVYQAPDDQTHQAAQSLRDHPRVPGRIVCISVMGPHKNIETVLRAMVELRRSGCPDASLQLVGGWPDRAYEQYIRSEVARLQLGDAVQFHGFVSREDLHRHYAEAQAFCLMSRCESFGIPAVEAQCFGVPVVCSNICAVPEICGEGGVYCAPDDIQQIGEGLREMLTDPSAWDGYSAAARRNAARFTWAQCSPPLVEVILEVLFRS